MMTRLLSLSGWRFFLLAVCGLTVRPGDSAAAGFRVERVVAGLDQPVAVVQAPGEQHSLYVVEGRTDDFPALSTRGQIVKYDMLTNTKSTFLAIDGINTAIDGGLHSLAFHPDYQTNGKFYVSWLESATSAGDDRPHLRLEEYVASGGTPTHSRTLFDLEHLSASSSHSIDWLGFQPGTSGVEQGYLYVTMGDGGILPGEPGYTNQGQDLNSLRGKVLRIDVDGADAYPGDSSLNYAIPVDNPYANDGNPNTLGEVFHSGLRNPWRASFDSLTGDLYIGDVGFNSREEIDFAQSGQSGLDFGWSRREGTIQTPVAGVGGPQGTSLNPIWEFNHATTGNVSITGGYVYRGPVEELQGLYFFADAYQERVFSGRFDQSTLPQNFNGANLTEFLERRAELNALIVGGGVIDSPVSFGEDSFGHLYIVDFGSNNLFVSNFNVGEIFRIVPDVPGDYNLDGLVDAADYTVWRDTLGSNIDLRANGDNTDGSIGVIDEADFLFWRARFGNTSGSGSLADGAQAIPEPAGVVLFSLAALIFGARSARIASAF